jgi:hypothetical protein
MHEEHKAQNKNTEKMQMHEEHKHNELKKTFITLYFSHSLLSLGR